MILDSSISAVFEVIGAFGRLIIAEEFADSCKNSLVAAGFCFSEPMLELGEDLFDWV